ncbi:MAG TPA: alpha/beta hydrolase [Caulobacteraceae bacterium]
MAIGFCLALACAVSGVRAEVWRPSAGHEQIELWPGAAPDAQPSTGPEKVTVVEPKEFVAGRTWLYIENVTRPTLTLFRPSGKNTGAAVIVFPGGGYKGLAIDLEGTEICDWLNAKGVACIVLKYRVPDGGPHGEASCDCQVDPKAPMALEDAQRAIGLTRFHAAAWGIDPHKIGVIGFSAGGHLVADVSTHWDKRAYSPVDAADAVSSRPDFAMAMYPGHMMNHTTAPLTLNPFLPVTAQTPPTFILQATDDPVDPVQDSLVYYIALLNAGVPVEMHLFATGGHAFGLRPTKAPITGWPALAEAWMKTLGVM